jgi:hypothetical protein
MMNFIGKDATCCWDHPSGLMKRAPDEAFVVADEMTFKRMMNDGQR